MWITLILQKVHNADTLSQQKSTYVQWQRGLINISKAAQVTSLLKFLMLCATSQTQRCCVRVGLLWAVWRGKSQKRKHYFPRRGRIYGFLWFVHALPYRGQISLPVCLPIVCCPLQSAWTSSSCMRVNVCRTARLTSTQKTSTAFPAMRTARIAMGQTQTTALSAPSTPLSSTGACVLKSVLKGLTTKKKPMTVKVGSCCFPQSCTEILEGLVEDYPKRAWRAS